MYFVSGANGNVGGEIVDQLLEKGEKVRVFVRDAAKVAHWGDRVQVAIGDFGKPETFARASAGATGIFLMNRGADGEQFRKLIHAVKEKGSPRIVFLSTLYASTSDSGIGRLHKDMEDSVRESGLPGKFLRPGGFMTNTYQWIGSIQSDGVVYNAMGTGRFAPVAGEDIAAVAVKALTDSSSGEEVFEFTGGELLSVPEQVSTLAEVLGRPIQSIDVPIEAAVQGMIRSGIPAHVAAEVGKSYAAIRDGRVVQVTDTVRKITGQAPMTFAEWARKHASRFL
jgi:uncharacterized protein YbjT (DUF2867 family)